MDEGGGGVPFRLLTDSPVADHLATFKRTSRSRQLELGESPTLSDIPMGPYTHLAGSSWAVKQSWGKLTKKLHLVKIFPSHQQILTPAPNGFSRAAASAATSVASRHGEVVYEALAGSLAVAQWESVRL